MIRDQTTHKVPVMIEVVVIGFDDVDLQKEALFLRPRRNAGRFKMLLQEINHGFNFIGRDRFAVEPRNLIEQFLRRRK